MKTITLQTALAVLLPVLPGGFMVGIHKKF